ncbi:hypothetical protein MMC28_008010 [Mycoblastus sanguinarius]|nr:hypothetical protein [Mycoblastus sanguinarius]
MHLSHFLPLAILPFSLAKDIHIDVGKGGLIFDPDSVTAAVGDKLNFFFYPQNHSVAQSKFASPCQPEAGGIYSGFFPEASGVGFKFDFFEWIFQWIVEWIVQLPIFTVKHDNVNDPSYNSGQIILGGTDGDGGNVGFDMFGNELGIGILYNCIILAILQQGSKEKPDTKFHLEFMARNAEIIRLTQALLPTFTDQMRRKVFIVHGLGGIGKTQLSVEFTRKHQGSYSAVFWIDGSSKERLMRSIADLARRLPQHQLSEGSRDYSRNGSADVNEVVEDVLKWLSRPVNDQWLLIFDNVDREFSVPSRDPEAFDVTEYFPTADQGSILITSRLASLWHLETDIKLEPVNEVQGASILENSLGRSIEGSLELVNLLQGLPLVINQAGSYIRKTGTNASKYIGLYDQVWARLIEKQHLSTLREGADRSILTTWTLSFNSLRSQSEDAANLLMLWAFLDNRDLWYELLAPVLDLAIADEVPRWFARCRRLLPHYDHVYSMLQRHLQEAFKNREYLPFLSGACHQLGDLYSDQGKMKEAEDMYLRALTGYEKAWGPEHTSTLDTVNNLGNLYSNQGKMKEAEDMYLRALAGYEKARGPEYKQALDTRYNLGLLYKERSTFGKAVQQFELVVQGYKKLLGPEHSETVEALNQLENCEVD